MKIYTSQKIAKAFIAVFTVSIIFLFCNVFYNNVNATSPVYSRINDIYVKLKYKDSVWEYRYPDIKYSNGIDKALDNSFIKDLRGRIILQDKSFFCSFILDDAQAKYNKIAEFIDSEPVNAEIAFYPDSKEKFKIKEDIKGKKLNIAQLIKTTEDFLSRGKSVDLEIIPENVDAEINVNSLKKSFSIREEFSTDFTYSTPERKHNIALSLSQFNGMVIMPEQEISFNKVVGHRTAERGYKTSKIIVGGEFVEGVGGGVCQTSTTLYNALILSEIKITEYHRHTLAVSYVPPSFDAMVNISTADLRFKNDSGNFLFVKAWTENNRAYVRIYGEKLPYKIKRRSTVTNVFDLPKEKVILDTEGKYKDIFEGERKVVIPSKPKKESIGELLYYKNGELFRTVYLRKDVYMQMIGKEIIGTAKKPLINENDLK